MYRNGRTMLQQGMVSLLKRKFSQVQPITHGVFAGSNKLQFVEELQFHDPLKEEKFPCYRVMNEDGSIRKGAQLPDIDEETAVNMYSYMVRLQAMDNIFYDAQRQGRMSFYMTSYGEEAIHIGSAAALSAKDMVFAQYREAGILMWRGFPLEKFADQCFSNEHDNGKGRQMPVHYGSSALHYQTISSPLGTQIPQAVGAAYSYKLDGLNQIACCYMGEGAASEGDFHGALNFASTVDAPVLFFVRNNGFAISTSVVDQFRGDGIVSRGAGYGMTAIRVDGNDLWAVYNATKRARELILEEGRPVLLEAMTYRQGHHSTSDDSTRYREVQEIKEWQSKYDPILRMKLFLESKGWWNQDRDVILRDTERKNVLEALQKSERKAKPALSTLFEDVYDKKPQHLLEQEKKMLNHIAKHSESYHLGHH